MIYLVDFRRGAVLGIDDIDPETGVELLVPDAGAGGPARGLAGGMLAPDGRLVLADSQRNRLLALSFGGATEVFDPAPSAAGPLSRPMAVAISPAGGVLVADGGNHRVVLSPALGAPDWWAFGTPGRVGPGTFATPTGVTFDGTGRALVADPGAGRLVRFNADDGSGWIEIPMPTGSRQPYALAYDPAFGVLWSDAGTGRVHCLRDDDSVDTLIDASGATALVMPAGIAVTGDQILVADAAKGWVSRWQADAGIWTMVDRLDGRGLPDGSGVIFSSLVGIAAE